MTPTIGDRYTLYHGDCLSILPADRERASGQLSLFGE